MRKTSEPRRQPLTTDTRVAPRLVKRRAPRAAALAPDVTVSESAAHATTADGLDHDAIRVRAYYLYLERHGLDGDPFSDWIRAERELTAVSLHARSSVR